LVSGFPLIGVAPTVELLTVALVVLASRTLSETS